LKPKIIIFGTPPIAADFFEKIADAAEIVAAVTAPDKKAGRGKNLQKSAVKIFAENRQIPVFCPEKLDENFAKKLQKFDAKIFFVFAFGKIFSKNFLKKCPKMWNFHPSLLPKFRGATPIPAAILAGETISGFSIFEIDEKMDAGPIRAQKKIKIAEKRADEIFEKMIFEGAKITKKLLQNPEKFPPKPQIGAPTFCQKIQKSDGLLIPEKTSAEMALRKIRAFFPWPSAFLADGTKFLRAQKFNQKVETGKFYIDENRLFFGFWDGAIEILEIQKPGKKVISGAEFCRQMQK